MPRIWNIELRGPVHPQLLGRVGSNSYLVCLRGLQRELRLSIVLLGGPFRYLAYVAVDPSNDPLIPNRLMSATNQTHRSLYECCEIAVSSSGLSCYAFFVIDALFHVHRSQDRQRATADGNHIAARSLPALVDSFAVDDAPLYMPCP